MRLHFLLALFAVALLACGSSTKAPAGPPPPSGPVTADALAAYVQAAFPEAVADGTIKIDWGSAGVSDQVIEELGLLGIHDMREVAALVPADFGTKGLAAIRGAAEPSTNVAGLMRDLMIIKDIRAYFSTAWRDNWTANGPEDFPLPQAYGVDFSVAAELGVFDPSGMNDDMGDDDYDGGGGDGDVDGDGADPCGGGE